MIFEHQSYRSFLKAELAERVRSNPSYSLRAMARTLGFSGSQLSEAMSGKANFSAASLRKIAKSLGLDDGQTEYLLLLGDLESQQDPEVREPILRRLQRLRTDRREIRDLSVDAFRQISEWYHSAILELLDRPRRGRTGELHPLFGRRRGFPLHGRPGRGLYARGGRQRHPRDRDDPHEPRRTRHEGPAHRSGRPFRRLPSDR